MFEFKPFLADMKSLNANDVATIVFILSPAEKFPHSHFPLGVTNS